MDINCNIHTLLATTCFIIQSIKCKKKIWVLLETFFIHINAISLSRMLLLTVLGPILHQAMQCSVTIFLHYTIIGKSQQRDIFLFLFVCMSVFSHLHFYILYLCICICTISCTLDGPISGESLFACLFACAVDRPISAGLTLFVPKRGLKSVNS